MININHEISLVQQALQQGPVLYYWPVTARNDRNHRVFGYPQPAIVTEMSVTLDFALMKAFGSDPVRVSIQ